MGIFFLPKFAEMMFFFFLPGNQGRGLGIAQGRFIIIICSLSKSEWGNFEGLLKYFVIFSFFTADVCTLAS